MTGSPILCTDGCDSGWLSSERCRHCRGTGHEPCQVLGCRDSAVVLDGDYLCERHESEMADEAVAS